MTKGNLKRIIIGKPLKNEDISGERLGILWGLPILSSDAISSVAYAGQEILTVLVPVIGVASFMHLTYITAAIIGLLALLTISYRQTIDSYPNGGGAYIVAKDNIGVLAGVTAGAALSIDYVLTVAVSISSGVEQIASAFTVIKPYSVLVCLALVILLMVGNLRGLKESARLFGIPAYAFMFGIISMIVVGIYKIAAGIPHTEPDPAKLSATNAVTLILLLRAFSNGCTALTGVEAVSNAVPNFRESSTKHAKKVLLLLSIIVLVLFGGTSLLANFYHVVPGDKAVLIQMAEEIFHRTFMFYFITATAFIILVFAANTAFSGFPMLVSVMAREGYAPRQLSMRGDRLSYSNGIIVLSGAAALLIVIFNAQVSKLIGLYTIGVFISFTLSQTGMFLKWKRSKTEHWAQKAFVNGLGAFVTCVVVLIVAVTKFEEGAWIVVVAVPILILLMLKVKNHYIAVARQLKLSKEEIEGIDVSKDFYRNRVIVPIESVNKSSIRALRYAKTISENVIAFSVAIDEETAIKTREKYNELNTDIPLIIKKSPFRKVVEPLMKFIESTEYDYQKGDMITVILPQFVVKKWWHRILHNHTWVYIQRELLKHKHIVVSTMPLQLKDDRYVLTSDKYK